MLKVLQCLHKRRRKRNPNEITDYFVCTANARAWVSCILCQNAPARTAWKNTTLIMDMNYKQECFCKSASAIVKCAPLQDTLERTTWRKLLECCCIDRNCCELFIELSGREVLSRMVKERHVPPSLPSWRQVSETWLQKRPPGRDLGDHCLLRRSGTTSIGTVALVFCWRMRSYHRTEFFFFHIRGMQHAPDALCWGEFLQQLDKVSFRYRNLVWGVGNK